MHGAYVATCLVCELALCLKKCLEGRHRVVERLSSFRYLYQSVGNCAFACRNGQPFAINR